MILSILSGISMVVAAVSMVRGWLAKALGAPGGRRLQFQSTQESTAKIFVRSCSAFSSDARAKRHGRAAPHRRTHQIAARKRQNRSTPSIGRTKAVILEVSGCCLEGEGMTFVEKFICWFNSIDWTAEAVTAAGTVVLAVMTFVLAFGTLFLWLATRRLVRGSEKTAERQLRAYMGFDQTFRSTPHGIAPRFTIHFKNCGQTPAYGAVTWVEVAIKEFPLKTFLAKTASANIYTSDLAPNLPTHISQINDKREAELTNDQVIDFDEGRCAFYIFGGTSFTDAFGHKRNVSFIFRYDRMCVSDGYLAAEKIESD
jgi:hypothetical protein